MHTAYCPPDPNRSGTTVHNARLWAPRTSKGDRGQVNSCPRSPSRLEEPSAGEDEGVGEEFGGFAEGGWGGAQFIGQGGRRQVLTRADQAVAVSQEPDDC